MFVCVFVCDSESFAFELATLLLPFLVMLTFASVPGVSRSKELGLKRQAGQAQYGGSALPWRNLHCDLIFLSHIPQIVCSCSPGLLSEPFRGEKNYFNN